MEAVEEFVRVQVPERTVEVRVHGVSGTPPQALLGAFPVRVEGDADAGFYRSRPADAPGGIAEAFSWGGLTSRRRITALWLFLAPLSLINVAGWMVPESSTRRAPRAPELWREAAMRLVAVVATVLVAAVAVQAAVSVMGLMTADAPLEPGRAAAAIVLAALVPAALQGLSRVGHRPDDHDAHDDPWGRVKAFRSLGAAHLGMGLAAVAALGLVVTGGGRVPTGTELVAYGAAAVAAALGVIAALSTDAEGPDASRRSGLWASSVGAVSIGTAVVAAATREQAHPAGEALTITHFVLAAAAAMLLAVAFLAERRMPVRASQAHATGFAALGLFMAYSAFGALSYALLGLASERPPGAFIAQPDPAAMFRLVDFAAVVLTCAVLWAAGRLIGIAAPLGSRGEHGVDAARRLRTAVAAAPAVLRRAGLGMLIASLALVLAELLRLALPHEDWAQRIGYLVTDPRLALGAVGWLLVAYVIIQLCRPRLSLLAGVIVAAVAVIGVGRMLTQAGVDAFAWVPVAPDATVWPTAGEPWLAASSFTLLAVVVAVFIPAASVVWFIVSASGNRESRRGVGVLWDLANFWPRMYHPWAPPPYSESAIPALENRLRHLHQDHPDHALVLSCHSQGAVLGFAAMRRVLERDEVPAGSLRLLTYGNLLAAHYQQLFPRLFDDARLASVERGNPGRWISLFRETDPLGHHIGVLGDRSRCVSHAPTRGSDHVLTHANYSYSPEFQAALDELARGVPPAGRGEGATAPDAAHGWRRWWLRR